MRTTRFITLLFLVGSIAFFFVPEFRDGLRMPILGWSLTHTFGWLIRTGTISPSALEEAARRAEQQKDARTLAFVALHSSNEQERNRLAEHAVALDRGLSWIYISLYSQAHRTEADNSRLDAVVKRLETWDAANAVPYLLEGELVADRRGRSFPTLKDLDVLAQETAWREAMGKAFAAPQYNSYNRERFELERTWLRANRLDRPPVVLLSVASYPIPNLRNIRMYAELLVKKFAKEAEQAGRLPEAAGTYWTVAHMGERLRLRGGSLIEQLIGGALQRMAYERLAPLLRKMGSADAAATIEYTLGEMRWSEDARTGEDPLARSSNYNWAALTVHAFAGLVVVFGLFTALTVLYVNLKRWVRTEKKGRIYQFLTVAENYSPILLFLACVGLFFSYYPFAQNFQYYMTAGGQPRDFEPLFFNVLPAPGIVPGHVVLPLGNPFVPYVWYALAGLVVAIVLALSVPRRAS